MLEMLARQLDVDVLITGHGHQCTVREADSRLYIDPGSATGAFSMTGPEYVLFVIISIVDRPFALTT